MAQSNRSRLGRYAVTIESHLGWIPNLRVWLLIGIPVSLLIGFFLVPLLTMGRLSFLEGMPPAPYTLENYANIFTNDVYLGVVRQTAWIAVLTTVCVLVLGYAFAYSIVRWSRYTTLLLLLLILPFWVNYLVRMYAWIIILTENGVLNQIEMFLGLTSDPSGYLYSFKAVLVGLVYVWLPLATLAFYASIDAVNDEHIEASKDLGAGPISTFFRVTLPLTKNGVIAGIVLVTVPAFGSFITPAMLGGTEVLMIGQVIEMQFGQAFNWPFGAALGMIIVVLVFLSIFLAYMLGTNLATRGGSEPGESA